MNLRGERFEFEHICWYPKDGELCLSRVKPGETLVEARSDSDVQPFATHRDFSHFMDTAIDLTTFFALTQSTRLEEHYRSPNEHFTRFIQQ